MPRFRPKPWMALTAILLLLVIAFFSTFYIIGGHRSSAVENLAGSAAAPAVSGASGFAVSVRDFFDRLFGLRDIDREYKEMQVRIQQLEAANQFMQDLQKENERLNDLLGFKEQYPDFTFIPARVIGKEPGSWFINFTLNRGSAQGVKKNNTVVNADGLIGKVVDVGTSWCKVMAIIDRQSSVSIIIERSRDNGVVDGAADAQSAEPVCNIEDLPLDAEIVPGDRVLTTDLGGYFPKGLPVGEVVSVSRDEKLQSRAVMKPYVDFAHLENVLIIKDTRGTPTEEEVDKEIADRDKSGEAGN
jgi:rod shape-determining protein MreC